jgi:formyltetrahydrofolate deformylase
MPDFVLTLVCPDRVGLVRTVAGFLADRGCNIVDSQQFTDTSTNGFFMRVHFVADDPATDRAGLEAGFAPVGAELGLTWTLTDAAARCRSIVLVSRFGHCLNDLLYRWGTGALAADIVAIVSNHTAFEPLAAAYDVPFHHLPVQAATRAEQEHALLRLVDQYDVNLLVLARYMQILSDGLCALMPGRIINIHHSFLPSFKGARPHHQAFERGVKLIGATAHYVTENLDEGPIIEQEVARVDHTYTPERLAAVGRELESLALSRAVQWHAEHRILLNGARTVIFR